MAWEDPPVLAARRATMPELVELCKASHNPSGAFSAWQRAARCCTGSSIAPILSLCVEASGDDACDGLGEVLANALTASLQQMSGDPSIPEQILSALLCFATRRLIRCTAGVVPSFCAMLQRTLHLACTRLFVPAATPLDSSGKAELALAAMLHALITSHTAGAKKSKLPQLNVLTVQSIAGAIIRGQDDSTAHPGHPGLLKSLTLATTAHEPVAESVAIELRGGGARTCSALRFLAACTVHLRTRDSVSSASALICLQFLHTLGRHAPLALAAGLDSGILVESLLDAVSGMSVSQKATARKLTTELVSCVSVALPSTVLTQASLYEFTTLLICRAADTDEGLPARTHAATQLAEFIEARQPWSQMSADAADEDEIWCCDAGAVAEEDESADVDESRHACVDRASARSVGITRAHNYLDTLSTLLAILPEASATSKPLTTKLLIALGAMLRHSAWKGSVLDLTRRPENDESGDVSRKKWLRLIDVSLEDILNALEASGDPEHPLFSVLAEATLGPHCLGSLLQFVASRSAASHATEDEGPAKHAFASTSATFAVSRLLRAQMIGSQMAELTKKNVGDVARALVSTVVASGCGRTECDVLLRSLVHEHSEVVLLLPAIAALLEVTPGSLHPKLSLHIRSAVLLLMTCGARMGARTADVVLKLMPLEEIEKKLHAETASLRRASSRTIDEDFSATTVPMVCVNFAIAPLLDIMAVAIAHSGGTTRSFQALTAISLDLALADATHGLALCLFAYPPCHAMPALDALLASLEEHADRGWEATAALMKLIGAAVPHVTASLLGVIRDERHGVQSGVMRDVAVAYTPGSAGADNEIVNTAEPRAVEADMAKDRYDYMLVEAEEAAEEDRVSAILASHLADSSLCARIPRVLACAQDSHAPESVRVAAVCTLGRFMHAHERIAESLLPDILELSSQSAQQDTAASPPAVRRASIVVFASLLPAYPSQVEPHTPRVLHAALAPSEPQVLRTASLVALSDLLVTRRLKPTSELQHVLPLLADTDNVMATRALECVHTLCATEGVLRWPRLLHSSLVALCPTLDVDHFSTLLGLLVPATLDGVRAQELESIGEALIVHLADAATFRSAADASTEVQRRRNVATLLGAWPASDKTVGTLLRAFGADVEGVAAGNHGNSPFLATVRAEAHVRGGLAAHVHRAKARCAGRTLESVQTILHHAKTTCGLAGDTADSEEAAGKDGDEDCLHRNNSKGGCTGSEDMNGLVALKFSTRAQRASIEDSARQAVAAMKAAKPIYEATRLPGLKRPAGVAIGKRTQPRV